MTELGNLICVCVKNNFAYTIKNKTNGYVVHVVGFVPIHFDKNGKRT